MSERTPQPGEWWFAKDGSDGRCFIVGRDSSGHVIYQTYRECQPIVTYSGLGHYQCEPDCTGWDWEPEAFPQWYIHANIGFDGGGYVKRTNKTEATHVLQNGRKQRFRWNDTHSANVIDGSYVKVSQQEAEDLIDKPQPVESPDDWVVQDRVPRRQDVDEFVWLSVAEMDLTIPDDAWSPMGLPFDLKYHGFVNANGNALHVRCRRKDLPPRPSKFAFLANEIEQLRADMMRRCDELGMRLTEEEDAI